jgi:carboxyvinyl-carboxyphosphonate phosphorylmutase
MAEAAGFEIGMMAGSTASGTVLGAPDIVVLTLTEFAEQIHRITRASSLSLMVDADHGYGNALNVMRTVEELEAAGVSALTIEDTLLPPLWPEAGEELISVPEFAGKLDAAFVARQDPALVIIGRIAALRSEGLQGRSRGKVCVDAGVDGIFLTGARTREEIEAHSQGDLLPLSSAARRRASATAPFSVPTASALRCKGMCPFQWPSKRSMMPTNTSRKAAHQQG